MSKPRTGAPKRVAVGLLAGALAIFGVALAPTAGATSSVTISRLAGATRYGTAAAIAGDATFAAPTTAIVATGENYPDALAASTLAGVNAPAPIVLTQTATYTPEAKSALAALKGKGITAVTIVGGTSAVSDAVATAIAADGFTVTRVAGVDRYATAAAIATAANTKSPSAAIGGFKTALIATGLNFPDALAGGPAAYANKIPLLLVTDTVPQATKDAIAALGIKKAEILGGTAAVSDAVKLQIDALTGNPSDRLAGTNRYGTAAAVGNYETGTLAFPATAAVIATGLNFPDALAAGPLGGQTKSPIVLSASCPAESSAFLTAHSSTIGKLFLSGGTAVIDQPTSDCMQTAAQAVSGMGSATVRPELQVASIVSTVTLAQADGTHPAGTTVAYTFDNAINAVLGGGALFFVYNSSGTQFAAPGGTATISAADNRVVNVLYPAFNTAAGAATLTTATVKLGAVQDAATRQNPEGDAGIGSGGQSTLSPGTTAAPNLLTASGFRTGTAAGIVAVDFTFDKNAFVQGTTGFHLVANDGHSATTDCAEPATTSSNVTTASGQNNAAGGNGSTIITVLCPQFPLTGTLAAATATAANVARAWIDQSTTGPGSAGVGTTPPAAAGTVNGITGAGCGVPNADVPPTTNRCNPLTASDTPHTATISPSLTSATFKPATNTTSNDEVDYTFDQSVQTAADVTKFFVYNALGTEIAASPASIVAPVNPQVNGAVVAVLFPNGVLANAVGASVRAGAVLAVAGAAPANQPDEVGVANPTATTVTPDKTAGPDLTSVTLIPTTVGFTTTYTAVYGFDKPITAAVPTPGNFRLYWADGTQLVCTAVSTNATVPSLTTSQALCTTYVFGPAPQVGTNTPGGTPTQAQVGSSVLGTVNNPAVTAAAPAPAVTNPEGARFTTGGTGTRV